MRRNRRYYRQPVLGAVILLLVTALTAYAGSSAPCVGSGARLSLPEILQIVVLHNQFRAEVGVEPLAWSPELAAYAQLWADHLASTRCGMEHRPRHGIWQQRYGENLYVGTAGYYGTADAVRAWAQEKNNYRADEVLQAARTAAIGHYTQMVWRNSRIIGCAASLCRGWLIVVCNYDPPGNFLRQKPY